MNVIAAGATTWSRSAFSFGGLAVDTAVVRQMLLVVQPAAVDAARSVATQEADRRQEVMKALSLEVEAARYAATLVHRQYDAVDPDNRLVAAELERRWNEALRKVRTLGNQTRQGTHSTRAGAAEPGGPRTSGGRPGSRVACA